MIATTLLPSLRQRILLAAIMVCLLPTMGAAQDHERKASPFDAVRWEDQRPLVRVDDDWYELRAIDDLPLDELLTFCAERWPGQTRRRFEEDLVEVMVLLGRPPGTHVSLDLVRLADGDPVLLREVEMSSARRAALRRAARAAEQDDARPAAPAVLSREQAVADLAELEWRLRDQFAYLHLRNVDWEQHLDDIRGRLPEQVDAGAFADDIAILLARFGDGHARVTPAREGRDQGLFTPFLIQPVADGYIAFHPDRSDFLVANAPFLVAMDGVPIEVWLAAAASRIPAGSPQLVRERSSASLCAIDAVRARLDHPRRPTVRCTLAPRPSALETIEVEVELVAERPRAGMWPDGQTRVIEGDIGYLRLARMDEDAAAAVAPALEAFASTRGLIVDVRGNGGGSRAALLALAPYLIAPDEPARVANVACYRLSERFAADHLAARSMYPADHPAWTERERAAIEACAAQFTPEWDPGAGFSAWHYLVLDRSADVPFYARPVIVLSDARCFSATDIFLGALKGMPRVTLMGEPSGGGSARAQRFVLTHSGVEVSCASMASFRPDGRLYDGRGVEVDVVVMQQPGDLLRDGADTVLHAAVVRLKESVPPTRSSGAGD